MAAPPSAVLLAFTLLLWLMVGYVVLGAREFPYPANVTPLAFGGAALCILTVLAVREVRGLRAWRAGQGAGAGVAGADSRNEIASIACVVAAAGLVLLLGFLVGMTLALVGVGRFYARERWLVATAVAVGVIGILYLAFGQVLGVPLYPGLIDVWPL